MVAKLARVAWGLLLCSVVACAAGSRAPLADGDAGAASDAADRDAAVAIVDSHVDTAGDALGADGGLPCLRSAPATWKHQTLPAQTAMFRITFRATPSHDGMDGVTGLSSGAAAVYDDLAVIVRFSSAGVVDARDGATYVGPTPAVPYTAGTTYTFRVEVDVPHGVYSAFVTPAGGSEHTIGTKLKFRDTQQGVAVLDTLNVLGNQNVLAAATHEVCGAAVTSASSYCGNGVEEPPEECDVSLACCDPVHCTIVGRQGTCTAGAQEILRVDFDKQAVDGYTQADLQGDFVVSGLTTRAWSSNHDRTDVASAPDAYAGRSLRGQFVQGVVGGAGAPLNFWLNLLQPYEELFVSYRVKFGAGFDFVLGGKLPGVGGGARNTGGNPPSSTDPEGFSVRMMWRSGGKVVFYVYHADLGGTYGEDFVWKCGGQDCVFTPGTWHTIEQRIVMNTPGQKDGIIQGWLDGQLALTVSNLRFRGTATPFSIDAVLWSNFFGGNSSAWAPSKNELIYFDDVVLSKGPITH